jgi:thiamine biosynthesis protein ThiS
MEMSSAETISLNGKPHPLGDKTTLPALLESLGFAGKPVVVELNETAVFPRDYPAISVKPGDRVEIVTLAAGG